MFPGDPIPDRVFDRGWLAGYPAAPLLSRAEFDELVEVRLILETAAARHLPFFEGS